MMISEVQDRLEPVDTRNREMRDMLHSAVELLRLDGATWVQIGAVLGTSPQAAQQRFGRP